MKPNFIALLALCLCQPLAGADNKKPGTILREFETGGNVFSSPHRIGWHSVLRVKGQQALCHQDRLQKPRQEPVADV